VVTASGTCSTRSRAALTLLLLTLGLTPALGQQITASDGKTIFESYCKTCHASGGAPRAPLPETLALFPPARIHEALTKGLMAQQGMVLSEAQKRAVANYVGRSDSQNATQREVTCSARVPALSVTSGSRISGWGFDERNTRFIPAEQARLPPGQLNHLEPRWSMVFPAEVSMKSQAAVAGNALYLASGAGTIYALDANTGCVHWKYQASGAVRGALIIAQRSLAGTARDAAYFADSFANLYALNAVTGALLWRVHVTDDLYSHVTATPVYSEGRLYVALATEEPEVPNHTCCV
jgi:polyvinyl alcohol dehydrogenase (cytochrome)